jgi:hypothetical protein
VALRDEHGCCPLVAANGHEGSWLEAGKPLGIPMRATHPLVSDGSIVTAADAEAFRSGSAPFYQALRDEMLEVCGLGTQCVYAHCTCGDPSHGRG